MKLRSEFLSFDFLSDKHENHFQRTPRTASLPAGNITLNCTVGGAVSSLTETAFNQKNRNLIKIKIT